MAKVFVSGSLRIKNLDTKVIQRLDNIINNNLAVIVGDADGVDSAIQNYLKAKGFPAVKVYCSGDRPRNNLGFWNTECVTSSYREGSREFFTVKDRKMADDCDYGLMVWDTKSTGTLSNIIELLKKKKISLVFVKKINDFITVKSTSDLERLVDFMSETSKIDANEKIGLIKQIDELKHITSDMFD